MRRIPMITLLIPLTLSLLIGCDKPEDRPDSRAQITYGALYNNYSGNDGYNYTVLTADAFYTKVANDESFLLILQQVSYSTSTAWGILASTIKPIINERKIPFYVLERTEINKMNNNLMGLTDRRTSNSLAIFKYGEVFNQRFDNPSTDPGGGSLTTIFNNTDLLKDHLNRLIRDPYLYKIDKTILDEKLATTDEKFIMYYARSTCMDCSYLNTKVLNTIFYADIVPMIYVIDCDEFTEIRDPNNAQVWTNFKNRYGLSVSQNATFGYDVGFVPTIQYIETMGSVTPLQYVKDAVTFFNDTIAEDNDNYVVTKSYYSEERLEVLGEWAQDIFPNVLVGLKIKPEDTLNGFWLQDKAAIYHIPLFQAFFDYYVNLLFANQ